MVVETRTFKVITQKGKILTIIDLSNTNIKNAIEILTDAQNEIPKSASNSSSVIIDAEIMEDTEQLANVIKQFIETNRFFLKSLAIVTPSNNASIKLANMSSLAGPKIRHFVNRAEAINWLASQP